MTVSEFLDKVRRQSDEVLALMRQRNYFLDQWGDIKGQRYDIDRVSGTKIADVSDRLAATEEKANRYAQKILNRIDTMLEDRILALKLICELSDTEIRSILIDRYISNMQWDAIAKKRAGIDERQAYRLAKRGLDELSEKFPEICQ